MEKNFSEKNRQLILALVKDTKNDIGLVEEETKDIEIDVPDYRIYDYIHDKTKYLTDIDIKLDLDNKHIIKKTLVMKFGQPIYKLYSIDNLDVFKIEYEFTRLAKPAPNWIVSKKAILKWFKKDGTLDQTVTKDIAKEIDSKDFYEKIKELKLKRENFVEEIKAIITNTVFEGAGLENATFVILKELYNTNDENYETFIKTGSPHAVLNGLNNNTEETMDNITIDDPLYPEYKDMSIRDFLRNAFTDF